MAEWNNPFRVNVGFIIAETIGYSREILFDIPNFPQKEDFDFKDISGKVVFTRTSEGVLVQGKLNASITTECVRCLEPSTMKMNTQFDELYTFSGQAKGDTDLILPPNAILDLTPLVREYFLLEIPIRSLCRPDCKGLCPVCGENLNMTECNHDDEDIDPRLDYFKVLLDK